MTLNAAPPSIIKLTIMTGPLSGSVYTFDAPTICFIGRDSSYTIAFPDIPEYDTVSREHCLLSIDPPRVSIRDIRSTHGTFVDRRQIGGTNFSAPQLIEKNLYSGNLISLGSVNIRIDIIGEQPNYDSPTAPLPPSIFQKTFAQFITWLKDTWEVPNNDPARLIPGKKRTIGSFNILQLLNQGSYSQIFLGENAQGQQVTIKLMLKNSRDTKAKLTAQAKMFDREIENAKVLNHPNVVRLVDKGFDPHLQCLYYAMEYCDAGNLATFMANFGGILNLKIAEIIIMQVLEGLEYIHTVEVPFTRLTNGDVGTGQGLVHRDLKPDNIMLTKSSRGIIAKIGDFGLSKVFEASVQSGRTISGGPLGTPKFICRKQIFGYQDAQPEVDVWAAAACLYHMLTGQYPRNLRPEEKGADVLYLPVIPILSRNPDIPAPLAAVIDRALAEDDNNKNALYYKSAKDFKNDLIQAWVS
jgi:eukaryotic-like serine/threonine-protein kinase